MRLYEYVFELQDRVTKTMEKISSGQTSMMRKFQQSQRAGIDAYDRVNRSARGYEATLGRLKRAVIAAFATGAILAAAKDVTAITAKYQAYENAINFASGSAEEAAKNQEFLADTIQRYRLPMEAATSGFKQLTASMMGTKLQGEQSRRIFDAVGVAATAMNLSGEQVNGTFLALGQIMSKGKVQAEELRGQLGERLPGAFNIAARAMGVTQAELNKMLETGQVVSEDFLPKFAAELRRTYEGALPDAINSLQANTNMFQNQVTTLKRQLGSELQPAMLTFFQTMTQGLQELSPVLIQGAQQLNIYLGANKDNMIDIMKSGLGYLKFLFDHRNEILFLAKAYLTYKAGLVAYTLAVKAMTIVQTAWNVAMGLSGTVAVIAATGIKTAADAWAAFNLIIAASPIGAVAALVGAAAGAFLLFGGNLKKSNDEFERFNKLQEDFEKGQVSRDDLEKRFQNIDLLSQNERQDLASQYQQEIDKVQRQLSANRIAIRDVDIDKARSEYNAMLNGGNASASQIAAAQNRINNYESAQSQIKSLTKSFDQLSNRLHIVNGIVKAGQTTPGGTDPMLTTPDAQTQQSLDGIIAGGKKVTHVTLNIDTINGIGEVISTTVGENLDDIGDKILEVVTRALNGATQTIGN
ncbi:tape measure protein [Roseivirga sp. UBA1976]|uniref:tape measure protein n=1 Tax=Roseivirga sp. UBA1976 TaxID=1947386 RepID=UPI00257BFBC8|nr:tape measure protein [Roseivirga sp. UBA1976]